MTDFFERQDDARKNTRLLIFLFCAAVAAIVLAVYSIISFPISQDVYERFWDPGRLLLVSFFTLMVIAIGTLYKVSKLSGGGRAVAEMLGGRLVPRGTWQSEERVLLNVVEEMAIASGVPVPDVYVMDNEPGINACAAGFGIDDAIICVTGGALTQLDRDELQGVVAHEFSHILNSDVAMNIRLMGWLHGILTLSILGQVLVLTLFAVGSVKGKPSGKKPDSGAGILALILVTLAVLGMFLYAIGYIGVFFGNLIKGAVSRQREYLADASAVQFTRNPSGLIGALRKILGMTRKSKITNPKAQEASHMFFSTVLGSFAIFASHPPLEKRIRRLAAFSPGPVSQPTEPPRKERTVPTPAASTGLADAIPAGGMKEAPFAMLDSIGAPMKEHVLLARRMIAELPDAVTVAAQGPLSACALVYALLLDPKEEVRSRQMGLLQDNAAPAVVDATRELAGHLRGLRPDARLPLLDLSFPALRQLSEKQYVDFRDTVNKLAIADKTLNLFEYVLLHVLVRTLNAFFWKPRKQMPKYSIQQVRGECVLVLSVFSRLNTGSEAEAAGAFSAGIKTLDQPGMRFELLPPGDCTLVLLNKALEKLSLTRPTLKRSLMNACLACLTFDRKVDVGELELFRAIAVALGVPVPPWLTDGTLLGPQEAA